ncbi:MAG: hypothetical protein KJZ80_10835 [Hyphomicrobiaceae bacterium]|nr:hypothetical protein [Hyphomicrobiaceae bacterium]
MSQPFEAPARLRKQTGRERRRSTWARLGGSLAGCISLSLAASGCVVEPMPRSPTALAAPEVPAQLLARTPEPKCTYTDEEPGTRPRVTASNAPANDAAAAGANTQLSAEEAAAAAAEALQRRERERDCFRDAEQRVRARLTELQASVRATPRAVERQASAAR